MVIMVTMVTIACVMDNTVDRSRWLHGGAVNRGAQHEFIMILRFE
jgi:hypothetical protein